MSLKGIIRGRLVELQETPDFEEGTAVEVDLRPVKQSKGMSAEEALRLAGTISHEDAEFLRNQAEDSR